MKSVGESGRDVSRLARGIFASEEDVECDGMRADLYLVEAYVESDRVPYDLVSETALKFVWKGSSREDLMLEEVICARVIGTTLVLFELGLRKAHRMEFRGDVDKSKIWQELIGVVPLFELEKGSGTFAVESERRIRRVRRSLLARSPLEPGRVRTEPNSYLLRAFAVLTTSLRRWVERSVDSEQPELLPLPPTERAAPEYTTSHAFPIARSHKRGVPLTEETMQKYLSHESDMDALCIKHAIFLGGIAPDARPLVWPFIAGVFEFESTAEERAEKEEALCEEYTNLLGSWTAEELDQPLSGTDPDNDLDDDSRRLSKLQLDRSRILKDVPRTDREVPLFNADDSPALDAMRHLLTTYAAYDPNTGYCQGMGDILAPIVYVFGPENESMCFWTFAKLMEKLERNFRVDQSGILAQLELLRSLVEVTDAELAKYFETYDPNYHSCFRWIIVQLKRELSFLDVMRLWEVLWLEHLEEDFQIYVAVGLLRLHKKYLLRLDGFDDLVRYINDMSMRIDVELAIEDAVGVFKKVGSLPRTQETASREDIAA